MDNRSNILACALRLFADRGYDAVGVQEIVDAAGITKPTLYHYFGNKHGLLEALLDEHFTSLNCLVKQAAGYYGDLPLTLTRLFDTFFQYARENPTFYRMQLGLWFAPENSEAHQAVARWDNEQFRIVEQVFAQAVQHHGNMAGRQSAYAATLIGMIHTYVGLSLNHRLELSGELVVQAVQQFQYGIYS